MNRYRSFGDSIRKPGILDYLDMLLPCTECDYSSNSILTVILHFFLEHNIKIESCPYCGEMLLLMMNSDEDELSDVFHEHVVMEDARCRAAILTHLSKSQ